MSVFTRSVSNTLTLTQSLPNPSVRVRTGKLGTTNSKNLNMVLGGLDSGALVSSLILTQTVTPLKIISRSRTSTLTPTQTVAETVNKTFRSTLTPTQVVAVDVQRFKSLTSTLHVTQTVVVHAVFNRSLTSTLVFTPSHFVPNGSGGFLTIPNLLYTSGGTADNPCCVTGRSTTVIQALTRSIVLPNPEYGDGESQVAAVSIKRTITGGTFTYVKKSNSRKLKYKFLITQKKAFELRQFVLDFLAQRVTLLNWKGELWSVNFLTDPTDIVSKARGDSCQGDLYEVEIDFQGIRIN